LLLLRETWICSIELSKKIPVVIMRDNDDEYKGLLDDDPALDCILFEEMRKEESRQKGRGGCLGMLIIILIPACYLVIHLAIT